MPNHLSYDVLNRLVEDRASQEEEASAQRHLARCARCRSERQWLERVRRASDPRRGPSEAAASPGCSGL